MEGEHFCGVTDDAEGKAEFVPIVPFKLQKLSEAMYPDDKEEAMTKFSELLGYLPPQMISSTSVNENGSVIQDAVRGGKIDFVRLLLAHGVDPTVGTDTKKETPILQQTKLSWRPSSRNSPSF